MITLGTLQNTTRPYKRSRRVGRGIGSGLGKTCGRGEKGAGSRAGYKRRHGNEGGQTPLYRRLPCRGFNNTRFRKAYHTINLGQINMMFEDGEVVNAHTLAERGYLCGVTYGIKVLGDGELLKKVTLEVADLSATAREKLQQAGISFSTEE